VSRSAAEGGLYGAGRRRARELAMQVLFELELTGHPVERALEDRLAEEKLAPQHAAFARELVTGTWARRQELDARIAAAAPRWRPEQLPGVEKAILRLAIYEVCFDNRTPLRAAINEAVELAKAYGGENSGRFVNGVLGSIASHADKGGDVHGRIDL
jgi:N utilization substance protein B